MNRYLDSGASVSVGGSVEGQMNLSSVVWGSGVTVSGNVTGPISIGSLSGVVEIGGDITTGYVQLRETVGDAEVSNSGANKIRGNSYGVTQAATLTKIEQYFDIIEPTPLVFFVYEADDHDGPYTLIHDETVENPGTGLGYYGSNAVNVELQVGKYYIMGAAWLGSDSFTYYWDEDAHPWPVTFGHTVAGYASIYFGNLPYYPDPSSSLLYCQRLTAMNPSGGSISVYGINGGPLNQGQVRINGSLTDSTSGREIVVGSGGMIDGGAIAVDYDGWDELDSWVTGATVSVNGVPYDGNEPPMHIWEIQPCKGDLNNDETVDDTDWPLYEMSETEYADAVPGLEGSRVYHSDGDFDGDWSSDDDPYIESVTTAGCCFTEPFSVPLCPTDLVINGRTDLADLSYLLAVYGLCEEDPGFIPAADFDNSGCIDLPDLAALLAEYGTVCDCPGGAENQGMGGEGFVPEGGAPPPIHVWFEAYDTGGYSGGGFNGEVDHFVFDLKVEVNDPNNDWVATGAVLPARNSATFRLSTSPTTPDAYATFVGAPWTTIPSGPGATQVIGAYEPPDPTYQFETTGINIGWYDTVDSENGPAAVMRLVIDVSAVEGADTSGGFGSVYFSQTGPTSPEDILVADFESETGHCFGGCDMHPLSGSFYVNGQ